MKHNLINEFGNFEIGIIYNDQNTPIKVDAVITNIDMEDSWISSFGEEDYFGRIFSSIFNFPLMEWFDETYVATSSFSDFNRESNTLTYQIKVETAPELDLPW